MYSLPQSFGDKTLQEWLDEAMRLPINGSLRINRFTPQAYYQPTMPKGKIALIRASTDPEKMCLGIDAVITVSQEETVSYTKRDMLVLFCHLLSSVELEYTGREGIPCVFINKDNLYLEPKVYKYFGGNNKLYNPLARDLAVDPSSLRYEPSDSDEKPINEMSVYDKMHRLSDPPLVTDEPNIYDRMRKHGCEP